MKAVDVRAAEVMLRMFSYALPRVVEVGCYRGDLSHRILLHQRARLVMVDPWGSAGASEDYVATGDPMATMTPAEWDAVEYEARGKVAFAGSRAEVLKMSSLAAAETLDEQRRFDIIFIDGDHSYSGTAADIQAWWPRVAPGGYLGGHDFRDDKPFGVVQAVAEFSQSNNVPVTLGGNYTWWARKA